MIGCIASTLTGRLLYRCPIFQSVQGSKVLFLAKLFSVLWHYKVSYDCHVYTHYSAISRLYSKLSCGDYPYSSHYSLYYSSVQMDGSCLTRLHPLPVHSRYCQFSLLESICLLDFSWQLDWQIVSTILL